MAIGALALLGVAAAQPAKAAVVNPGFEGFPDFTGYTIVGNDTIVAGDFRTPAEGLQQALIDTAQANVTGGPGNPVAASALETFLGLSAGSLSGLGATNGSAIRQNVAVTAGDTITFKYDLFTQEPLTAGRNDFGFVTLNGTVVALATASGALLPPPAITGTGDNAGINSFAGVRETGYNMFSITAASTGTLALGFGAVNVGDTAGQTGLLVDAITLVPGNGGGGGGGVPLPAGMYLMPLGLALAGLYSVKLRRTVAA